MCCKVFITLNGNINCRQDQPAYILGDIQGTFTLSPFRVTRFLSTQAASYRNLQLTLQKFSYFYVNAL